MLKIVLDAGHGGSDPGAIGNGLKEKDVNLLLAMKTGANLEARGAKVLYTRATDIFITLEERAKIANRWKADFFFSFHVNSSAGIASGFESFIYSEVNGGKTAAYQNVIHRKIAAVFASVGVHDRGQKKANLAVLRETNMPACLAEYGFINSAKDAALLMNESFLDRLAQATADGIAEALGLPKAVQPACDKTAEAIEVLHKAGVISSPQYWMENARPGRQANGEYVGLLIQGMAAQLK